MKKASQLTPVLKHVSKNVISGKIGPRPWPLPLPVPYRPTKSDLHCCLYAATSILRIAG